MKTFEELKAVAEKANQRPFISEMWFDPKTHKYTIPNVAPAYASFVIDANPVMVLALLAEIDRLKAVQP
jgi:hypothetical protein